MVDASRQLTLFETPDQITASGESYKGARLTRKWRGWQPDAVDGDTAIADSMDMLLRRIREMGRDDATIKAAKRSIVKHVIGTGILAFADARMANDPTEYDDDAFNDPSDELFERWSDERECDIAGKLSFEEMQAHAWNEMMESGECLWLRVDDDRPGRTIPLAYQLLESEQLDESRDWDAGADQKYMCRRGIEYDVVGRPVAYWIFDAHPYGDRQRHTGFLSRRIPAERIIHTFLPNRISESRGVTWFTNLQSAKDLDWYLSNELTAAALGALFAVAIKREHGQGSGTGLTGSSGTATPNTSMNSELKLGQGIISDIGANDAVEIIESKRPNRDAKPFIDLILQTQAMSVGISRLRLTADYSETSYTSARAAHLDDAAFFQMLQRFGKRNFVRPVRREAQRAAVASGLIRGMGSRQYLRDQMRLENFFIQPPGREQIDPEKETNAAAARIRYGVSTHAEECGKRGLHWRKVARQQARENAFWKKTVGRLPDLGESAGYLAEYGERSKAEAAAAAAATTNGGPA